MRYTHTTSRFTDIDLDTKALAPINDYSSHPLVSLEQALEPILPLIDRLSSYIESAKACCYFPSKHGLTRDESAAIYLYTMEGEGGDNCFYRVLNQTLRGANQHGVKPWFAYLKLFNTALGKLPPLKGGIWRGVPGDMTKSFKKDQVLTWWSVNSCSSSVDVVKKFLSTYSTLFLIEAVNGKDVSAYTSYPDENEVLLRPGTQLLVKSNALDHPGGLLVVHLVELTDEQLPSSPKPRPKIQNRADGNASGESYMYFRTL
jgi:hypothetical protein